MPGAQRASKVRKRELVAKRKKTKENRRKRREAKRESSRPSGTA